LRSCRGEGCTHTNSVDDGLEDVADAVDDGHEGVSDGTEAALDLFHVRSNELVSGLLGRTYARDDGTHCCCFLFVDVVVWRFVVVGERFGF
jgi:hypothetical protein